MRHILFIFILVQISFGCWAGSNQPAQNRFAADEIATFAKGVEHYAAQQGARAFLIGRLGQPEHELPKGFQFTHTAVAVYSSIQLDNGESAKGYAIYNLYQQADDPNKSLLMTDYPVDFFWGVNALKAGIIIPTPSLQTRIINAITDGTNEHVFNPHYSLIANPFNNTYQNCTEHTLNLINAAIYQTDDIQQIKANTKAYFSPQKLQVSRIKLALGNWFADGVSTSDHSGTIYTTSFTSIARYLKHYDLLVEAVVLDKNLAAESLIIDSPAMTGP